MGDSYRHELSKHRRNHKSSVAKRGVENSEVEDRKQVVNAFFQKKGKFPTAAQLRMFLDG